MKRTLLIWSLGCAALLVILVTMANISPGGEIPGSIGPMQELWYWIAFGVAGAWFTGTMTTGRIKGWW